MTKAELSVAWASATNSPRAAYGHVLPQRLGRVRAELLTMASVVYYYGEGTARAGLALGHAATSTEDDNSALPRLAEIIDTALQAFLPRREK